MHTNTHIHINEYNAINLIELEMKGYIILKYFMHAFICPNRGCPTCSLQGCVMWYSAAFVNPLMPELNPSVQHCLMRFFNGDFASWTMYFINICANNQQMQQLLIQFINYVWQLLCVSALHCHLQGAFLVPSERSSIEEQSTEYCGWAWCI
jgi:hypothetical protein